MLNEYAIFNKEGGKICIRKDALKKISNIKAILFDCDGVLIDARESYDKSIVKTVSYIISEVTGCQMQEEKIVSKEQIYRFRKSGGFNNDWDTAYVILLYLFSKLPLKFLIDFHKAYESIAQYYKFDTKKRLLKLREKLAGNYDIDCLILTDSIVQNGLLELAYKADSSGVPSVEKFIINPKVEADELRGLIAFKDFLAYPKAINQSLLKTIFEEFFYGPKLFSAVYGIKPFFNFDEGLIKNEKVTIEESTLSYFVDKLGRSNLGIVSGRGLASTSYTLGPMLDYFNPNAIIFLEDEERRQNKLRKPNPYPLLKAIKFFPRYGWIAYVGDSIEDLLMVHQANKISTRFIFSGIYGNSPQPNDLLESFLKERSDIVIPSVNDLPFVSNLCGYE